MYAHTTTFRVRYAHTDQMGYLYYGHYPMLYEIGRVEMIRSLGLSYKTMETEHRVMMPVMSLQMRYVRPALYDEVLEIRTSLPKLPEQTITFQVEVYNEAGKLVNGGSVKLCFVDMESGKTVPTPDFLLDQLRPHFVN